MIKFRNNIFKWLLFVAVILITASACKGPTYYSSTRVYNARSEQAKRMKKRGYSNQQYKKSPRKRKRWNDRNTFRKKKFKTGGKRKGRK
jgi:predicted small lipoprotein YifL